MTKLPKYTKFNDIKPRSVYCTRNCFIFSSFRLQAKQNVRWKYIILEMEFQVRGHLSFNQVKFRGLRNKNW